MDSIFLINDSKCYAAVTYELRPASETAKSYNKKGKGTNLFFSHLFCFGYGTRDPGYRMEKKY
jgi:hypothetical protein